MHARRTMPAACDFKFAAEDDGCPAGMVRGVSGAPGLLRDASGAPCVAHLYVAALRRTIALARALEARVRQRLLCRSHLEPLRAELGYLPGAREAIDEALRDAPWVFSVT